MLPFKTCCLCCKLETGAYTLAILGLISNIFSIVICSLALDGAIKEIDLDQSRNVLIIAIVWAIISLGACALLIVGTTKKDKRLLIPFLILSVTSFLLHVFVTSVDLATRNIPSELLTSRILGLIIGVVLWVYIWLCMLSLYLKLKKETIQDVKYKNFTT